MLRTTITLKFKMCLDEASYWAEKFLTDADMSSFSLEKKFLIWFCQSIWPAVSINVTTAFTILNCRVFQWKDFWSKGDSSHFENAASFLISWTESYVFRINERLIQQLSAMFDCQDGKGIELSSQAWRGEHNVL